MKIATFLKDWTLIISMLCGIASYFIYVRLPFFEGSHELALTCVGVVQPVLIFAMLYLTFCRIDFRDLRLCRWHWWLLAIQCGVFLAIAFTLILMPHSDLRVVLEGVMICLICPTATAGAVVTRKLGGDVASITTYTILINIATAVLIPIMVPFVHPHIGGSVLSSAMLILCKVFPLLLFPLLAAYLTRLLLPKLHRRFAAWQEVSFYLWAVSLALALAMTTRSIVHSTVSLSTELWLVVVSLVCCVGQFAIGRHVGKRHGAKITAGQSLGQKNTVLAIWMGYTFFSPITAVVGGFYSIWHNVINSYQLYRHNHPSERK